MSRNLKPGDRVHVLGQPRLPLYHNGDKGTVTPGPDRLGVGGLYYLVEMDRDRPPHTVVFAEGEIELDVRPPLAARTSIDP